MQLQSPMEKRLDGAGYLLLTIVGALARLRTGCPTLLIVSMVVLGAMGIIVQIVGLKLGFTSEESLMGERVGGRVKALSWGLGMVAILVRSGIFFGIGFALARLAK